MLSYQFLGSHGWRKKMRNKNDTGHFFEQMEPNVSESQRTFCKLKSKIPIICRKNRCEQMKIFDEKWSSSTISCLSFMESTHIVETNRWKIVATFMQYRMKYFFFSISSVYLVWVCKKCHKALLGRNAKRKSQSFFSLSYDLGQIKGKMIYK